MNKLVICADCKFHRLKEGYLHLCKHPEVTIKDPISGITLLEDCKKINKNGDCKLWEANTKYIDNYRQSMRNPVKVGLLYAVILAILSIVYIQFGNN